MHTQVVAFLLFAASSLLPSIACGQDAGDAAPATNAVPVDHFDEITLERTACFGACPMYKIVIHADGTVEYEGIGFVKLKGAATGHISQQQVTELVRAINAADYFSLRDSYRLSEDGCPTNWTDNPSAITSVTIGGQTKTIIHDYGCREKDNGDVIGETYPRELVTLESTIDDTVGIARWIGTQDERRRQMNGP